MKKSLIHYTGFLFLLILVIFIPDQTRAQDVQTSGNEKNGSGLFKLSNENISLSVVITGRKLIADTLSGNTSWLRSFGSDPFSVVTDGDFGLKFVWTDWQAPKKQAGGYCSASVR